MGIAQAITGGDVGIQEHRKGGWSMNDYHLLLNGMKSSLFTEDSLRNLVSKNKIDANQMVSVNNGPWVRLYEVDGFKDLAPVEKKPEEKQTVQKLEEKIVVNSGNFVFCIIQTLAFGLFLCFAFSKFSAGHLAVWLQILFVSVYSLTFANLISNDKIKKQVMFLGYVLLVTMWSTILTAYMR
jgi:hypothetical protein